MSDQTNRNHKCAKCGRNARYAYGDRTDSWCRACHNAATRAWKTKNKDKVAQHNRDWWAKNPEYQKNRRRTKKLEKIRAVALARLVAGIKQPPC